VTAPVCALVRDPELEAAFTRDGYVVIPGFCTAEQVAALQAAYQELGPAPGDEGRYCHFDFQSPDRAYKRATDAAIRNVMAKPLAHHLAGYRPYYGNYVMKWPSPTSWFGVHQDSAFVDEQAFRSASIWVPTVDVDADNGAVWFFPGSHLVRAAKRGSNQQVFVFQGVADPIEERCGKMVAMRAGDALVFDHRVVHWSYANFTDLPRLVAVLGVVPNDAALLHHRVTDDGERIETYQIDDGFFIDQDPFGSLLDGLSGYSVVGDTPFDVEPLTPVELDAWMTEHPIAGDVEVAAALRSRTAAAMAEATVVAATENRGRGAPGPLPSAHVIDTVVDAADDLRSEGCVESATADASIHPGPSSLVALGGWRRFERLRKRLGRGSSR